MKNICKATASSNRIFKSALAFSFLLLVAFVTSSLDFPTGKSAVKVTSDGNVTGVVMSHEVGGHQSAPRSYALTRVDSESSILGQQNIASGLVLDNCEYLGDIGGPQSAPRPYALNSKAIQDIGGTGNPPRNFTLAPDKLTDADAKFDIGGTQALPRPSVIAFLKNGDIGGQGNQAPRTFQGLTSLHIPIGGQRVPADAPPKLYLTTVLLGIEPIGGNSSPRNLKNGIALNFAS